MAGQVIASLRTDSALHEVIVDDDGQHWALTTFFATDPVELRLTPGQAQERVQTYRNMRESGILDRSGVGVGA